MDPRIANCTFKTRMSLSNCSKSGCEAKCSVSPIWFSVVQLLSHVRLFVTLWTAACQASLSFTISLSLLKLMSTESMMHPTTSFSAPHLLLLPSIFPSIRVFPKHPYLKMHVSPGRHQPPSSSQIPGGGNLPKSLNRQTLWAHLTEFVERHRSVGRD